MNCDVIVGVNKSKFIVLAFEKIQFPDCKMLILAMNVFEFLFITLPYVFGFLYFVFQLPYLYFHILHSDYLCRIMSSNQKSSS